MFSFSLQAISLFIIAILRVRSSCYRPHPQAVGKHRSGNGRHRLKSGQCLAIEFGAGMMKSSEGLNLACALKEMEESSPTNQVWAKTWFFSEECVWRFLLIWGPQSMAWWQIQRGCHACRIQARPALLCYWCLDILKKREEFQLLALA